MRKLLFDIMLKFIHYWDGSSRALSVAKIKFPALAVVVSRKCYIERTERLPIVSATAAKQVLYNQVPAEYFAVFVIEPVVNNHRTVRSFLFHNSIRKQFPSALFWVPESWLFGNLLTDNSCALVETGSSSFFVALADGRICSLPVCESISSVDNFKYAIGRPFINKTTLANLSLQQQLVSGLKALTRKQLQSSFVKPLNFFVTATIKFWLVSIAVLLLGYASLTSAYLILGQAKLQESSQTTRFQQLLTQHDALSASARDGQRKLDLVLQKKKTAWVWSLMARLHKLERLEITGFQLTADELIIRGQAENATAILEWLRAQPDVANAFFDAPVRSAGRNQESFVIRVQLFSVVNKA